MQKSPKRSSHDLHLNQCRQSGKKGIVKKKKEQTQCLPSDSPPSFNLFFTSNTYLLIFFPGRKSSLWLCVWCECHWVPCYTCTTEPDEHLWSLTWLRCKCFGILPATHGDSVHFCSCLLTTVSISAWQQDSYEAQNVRRLVSCKTFWKQLSSEFGLPSFTEEKHRSLSVCVQMKMGKMEEGGVSVFDRGYIK